MSSTTIAVRAMAERVRHDLAYLIDSWPFLVELRVPGTARRWTDRSLGPLADFVSDDTAPGSPSPAVVSILDLLQQIAASADDMCQTVCRVLDEARLHDLAAHIVGASPDEAMASARKLIDREGFYEKRYRPMLSALIDPREHLRFVVEWAGAADEIDDRTMPWLAQQLAQLATSASAQLGEARHGQVLAALCPWCGGRTPVTPTGGARTLVLRMPDEESGDGIGGALIVCSGTGCEPPEVSCSMRDGRGRPAWPWREWQWLASQLTKEDV